ncbi:MAG: hypothetical protein KC645_12125, partial [Gemmatimonadetes bacterium]|nr:hypothetical protein [Gemmatimonadota bacterium]
MRVFELAQTLSVDSEELLVLLRQLGIRVADRRGSLSEADVARVIARVERERRAGHRKAGEAIQAVIEDSKAPSTRRRRRRAEPEPEPEEEPAVEAPAAEARTLHVDDADFIALQSDPPPAAEPEPEPEDRKKRYKFEPKEREATERARGLVQQESEALPLVLNKIKGPRGLSPAKTEFLDEDQVDRLTLE